MRIPSSGLLQPNLSVSRRAIRVLIVDDSAVMRSLLRSVVNSDPRLEVAGTASDGASALVALDSIRPDLILLDVEMPVMDGLVTLRQIKARGVRVPVVMCSSLTQRGGRVTIEALASGAADYVAKPSGQSSREAAMQALAQDLIPKIIGLTSAAIPAALPGRSFPPNVTLPPSPASAVTGALPSVHPAFPLPLNQYSTTPPVVVLIGVSTGGPSALEIVLPALPANFPLPVLVVQHMPEVFTGLLAERLNGRCPMRVSEAIAGEPVRSSHIYIAKGDWHLEVAGTESSATLRLSKEIPENHCRPAVDVLFRSAVQMYGSRVLGVVLTGMGYDGLAGARLIRQHNGTVLAQDQATSAVWGMPGAVADAGLAQRILPLGGISPEILRLAGRMQREAIEPRESVV